jgi:hypothetical protein
MSPLADRGAQCASERIGRELRRVELPSAEPAELRGDLARADPCRLEHGPATDERHRGAACGGRRPAAVGIEAGIDDLLAVDGQRDANRVAAVEAADFGAARLSGRAPMALGRGQMVFEGERIHAAEDTSPWRTFRR